MRIVVLFLFVGLLTGCVSAYSISGGDEKGIPFYIKKGVFVQTTKYELNWVKVILDVGTSDKDTQSFTYYLHADSYDKLKLDEAVKSSLDTSGDTFSVVQKFEGFFQYSCDKAGINCRIEPKSTSVDICKSAKMVSNSAERKVVVDYSKPYYFNAKIPLFTSTTSSMTLASDGTLSEASSTIDTTKLADVFMGSVPAKDILMDKWGIVAGAAAVTKSKGELKAKIITSGGGLVCTYTKEHDAKSHELPWIEGISNTSKENKAFLTVTLKSAPKKKKEKENKDTINVNGSIKLPKAFIN
ncbi:hypothetical protein D8Y20_13295 [Mariprofundus sp. EBB-1]|uniref:hypothetical protein n=1 Tax=Mariprofundus sp. EBB-1 TaxID=2650971 RepID=UPI000EF183B6|nr:hypothetical protein [Mariprofundus sp. EBB-1]RLL49135.1 hypothetical protein D8Y20_13295 [Mariprofundus sp. EBB-1]